MNEHDKTQQAESPKEIERRRKRFNDYGMLIGTMIAAVATVLAWHEARLTREETHHDAEGSLKIQQQSVQAQIDSLQTEQRPFIRVDAGPIAEETTKSIIDLKPERVYVTNLNYSVSGKTPALNVRFFYSAEEYQNPVSQPDLRKRFEIVREDEGSRESLIYPGTPTSSGPIQYPQASDGIILYGYVLYDDLFHLSHRTEFCYRAYSFPKGSKERRRPALCPGFIPTIT
jgi:hypothetical protein